VSECVFEGAALELSRRSTHMRHATRMMCDLSRLVSNVRLVQVKFVYKLTVST